MKMSDYVKTLAPELTKEVVLEDARLTVTRLKDDILPAYEQAAKLMVKWKFNDEAIRNAQSEFKKTWVNHKDTRMVAPSDNFIVILSKCIPVFVRNLEKVSEIIADTWSEDVRPKGLTFKNANLLQFVEISSFVSKYMLSLLDFVYVSETAAVDEDTKVDDNFNQKQLENIKSNYAAFLDGVNICGYRDGQIEELLNVIPDITVHGTSEDSIKSAHGQKSTDPMNMSFIPISLNPIYHIRMGIAAWQISNFKASKEEVKLLQLRLLYLQRAADGKKDARLEKEISYLKDLVDEHQYKIAEMERRYA